MSTPEEFTRIYGPSAARAGKTLGVDPAILLGQFGLETGWGKSIIPGTNNLGNIKDFSTAGTGVPATDNMTGSRDRYRAYDTPDAFFDDYVSLIQRKYPQALGTGNDALKFARALKFGGYAEDPDYIPKMVSVTNTVRKLGDKLAEFMFPAAQAATVPNFASMSDDELLANPSVQNTQSSAAQPSFASMSDDDLLAGSQSRHNTAPVPTRQQRNIASAPMRVLKGGKDTLDAGAQMLVHAMPSGIIDSINNATRYVNDLPVIGPVTKALGMTPATAQEMDAMLEGDEHEYQAARAATGQSGFDGARLAGSVASSVPLLASIPGAAVTIPGRVAASAAGGAMGGMMSPVLSGDYLEEKAKQAAIGAGTGGLLSTAGVGLGRFFSPKAAQNPQVQTLLNEGVTPTPGQMMGGVARTVEDKAMSVPILGDAIRAARNRGINELNHAVINRVVAPIGGKVRSIGREGMREAGDMISQAYEKIIPRMTFRTDGQFARDFGQLQLMARQMPPAQAQQFENIVRTQMSSRLTNQGVATGQNFREMESEIGRLAQEYLHSASASERQLGTALVELQKSLRASLQRSNPQLARELGQVNQAYSLLTRLQRAVGMQGADDGIFSPTQLSAAVRASDRSARHGKYARGEAAMQDLSDAARSVMRGTVPNSGTADRLLLSGGTALFSPIAAASLGAAALPYLPGISRFAATAFARRPDALIQSGQALQHYAPAISVLFGQRASANR